MKALKEYATQVPFSCGEAATSVCNAWQLDSYNFFTKNDKWDEKLDGLVEKIAEDLGCESFEVTYELHKLLLFEPGGFSKVSICTV